MVGALRIVDKAILGDNEDFYEPVRRINPDIIVLGYDQHFLEKDLQRNLRENGIDAKVVRMPKLDGKMFSSREIAAEIVRKKSNTE